MDEQQTESPTDAPTDQGQPAADVFLDIAADPERVWSALTTAGGLAPWMGDGASLEPRPGGSVVLPDPVGGVTRRGRVERVDDGRRLDFAWWPALRPADRTEVSITVSPTESGCRVRVIEAQAARRAGAGRLPIGIWSWRLALLSLSSCMSRI